MNKARYIIGGFILILYVIYIKFFLPVEFISYENYHGITYLNTIYNSGYDSISAVYNGLLNIFHDGAKPHHGFIPKIFYGYIYNIINFEHLSIFQLQSLLSIISYIFFSYFLFLIFNKDKKIFFINFLLLLTLPHQIKYGFSEDYYIFGNLLISVTLLFYTLFLIKKKILYYFLSITSFILAIYTRNLYLLYLPIFFLLTIYFFNIKFFNIKFFKSFSACTLFLFLLGLLLLIFFIFDRGSVLLGLNTLFPADRMNISNLQLSVLDGLIPIYFIIFFLIGILLLFFIRIKSRILYLFLCLYLVYLLYKYMSIGIGLERHILFLEPLFIFIAAIGVYLFYSFLSKYLTKYYLNNIISGIIIILFLFQPFIYKDKVQEIFSTHEEYIFIKNNITKIGNNLNIFILRHKHGVSYDFPYHLLSLVENYNYNFYKIDDLYNRSYLDSFIDNNVFYLSTACYSTGDIPSDFLLDNGIREDCKYMLDNYDLEAIIDKKILAKTYIIPYIDSSLKEITIGFYRIKGLKEGLK